ncbi:hypothetical protein JCM19240_2038 [Vibrio maritimus]|uniref:Uncharacterized protein n=1 Tax=Vibrio maritimus TaxID=990268 RepID=A0A090TQC2_9VIBR|nr:hypothetical protein JCM19240_2038 [Vibrio maritimus]
MWRQNIGSSAGSKVELKVDAKGVTYKSGKVNNTLHGAISTSCNKAIWDLSFTWVNSANTSANLA